ncbi:MAG: AbrB/MazE/SpoVT family DNA-binding domain-containing protein [Eubacteriales bacterium]|nr:AbrB/MazE/SpoVT family DNA-binding domain-containing protein [Eubacteriales bacterium]MDD3350195.1 AbrB/MazE/SpoVT family DNA-binding domain-containing protein [Eubacteriales bacterium]
MKALGIVRKVDGLGRVVLPAELRNTMGIDLRDPLELFVEDDFIILKKYQPQCVFCGSMDDLIYFKDKKICRKCMETAVRML